MAEAEGALAVATQAVGELFADADPKYEGLACCRHHCLSSVARVALGLPAGENGRREWFAAAMPVAASTRCLLGPGHKTSTLDKRFQCKSAASWWYI